MGDSTRLETTPRKVQILDLIKLENKLEFYHIQEIEHLKK